MRRPSCSTLAGFLPALKGLVVALALSGELSAQEARGTLPDDLIPDALEVGRALFEDGTCVRCHGPDAGGTERGPDLTDSIWLHGEGSFDDIFWTLWWGVRPDEIVDPARQLPMYPRGGMPIDWDQSRALAAYVWTLSRRS